MIKKIKEYCNQQKCYVDLNFDPTEHQWTVHFWTTGFYHTKTLKWGTGKTLKIAFDYAMKDKKKYEIEPYSEGY